MNTTDVIRKIIKDYPKIKYVYIVEYGNQKDVKKDSNTWSSDDNALYEQALNLRRNIGLPFWQSVMLSSVNASNWSKVCLDACTRHNSLKYKKISVYDFLHSDFTYERVGISSRVILSDLSEMHIPFIDFQLPISDINSKIVEYICRTIDNSTNGYILNSGNSYHYIGNNLLSYKNLVQFLAKANMFTPITDCTWISHQLYEGSCTLRLGTKNGKIPIVIRVVSSVYAE